MAVTPPPPTPASAVSGAAAHAAGSAWRVLRFAMRHLWRDWRAGELAVLAGALVLAVAALTAVGFFTSRVSRAVDQQAAELLAADLRVESARPLAAQWSTEALRHRLTIASITTFPTAVFHGEDNALVTLRAVSAGYPLRGTLRIAAVPFGPAQSTQRLPSPGTVWVESRVLARFGMNVGDLLSVGASELRVAAVLDYRPDQGAAFADLAPTVLLGQTDLAATRLLQNGSRATYAQLYAGTPSAVAEFRSWLEREKGDAVRVVALGESSEQLKGSLDRAQRFLLLSALATLLLCAVAVAMAARRYAARHLDLAALMKCMGASQRFVLATGLWQLALIALAGAALGVLLGFGAQAALAWLLRDLFSGPLPPPAASAAGLGLVTALAMLLGFALPPLLQLRAVPVLRVLRHDVGVPGMGFYVAPLCAVASLGGLLWWLLRDLLLVATVFGGLGALVAVLWMAGLGLVRVAALARRGTGGAWRYGLANVGRRGAGSVVQVVAFGLGLTVLLLLAVVRNDLLREWRASLPADAPNHFLINIAPEEVAPLQAFLRAGGVTVEALSPWVRARLVAVNNRPVSALKLPSDRGRAFAEREQNLSWSATLPRDNTLVAGHWWPALPAPGAPAQVSLASEFATALGLFVGDQLVFDVAGERLTARVANVRQVQWDSFRPNFFVVLSPGALEGAAGTYMTSVHLAPAQRRLLAPLVHRFPGVSVFDVEALLVQVRQLIDRASQAVQGVFLFTLGAGVMVLAAAVQSTRDERRFESAILRTLGASRAVVIRGIVTEFVVLGLLSGVLASTAAAVAGAFAAHQWFHLAYSFDPLLWSVGLGGGAGLVGVAGWLATRGVVNTSPLTTLRH